MSATWEIVGTIVSEAIRRIRRRPATPMLVAIVIAVAIGVSTAIFAIADPVLFRPLPFRSPSQLVVLPSILIPPESGSRRGAARPAQIVSLDDIAQMTSVFSESGAYIQTAMTLSDLAQPLRVTAAVVTPSLFDVLGVHAVIGRTFDAGEGRPHGRAAVLLGYSLWRDRFGGRALLDSTILLNGHPYTVVGILPATFGFPSGSQVWLPMTVPLTTETVMRVRGAFIPVVVARIRDGVSLARAARALDLRWQQALAASDRHAPRYSNLARRVEGIRAHGSVVSLQSTIAGDRRPLVTFFLWAIGLNYLIVCANLTGVLLADGLRRRREFIVREALGARRARTIQRLFVENLVACTVGGIIGIGIASALIGTFHALLPASFAGLRTVGMNLRVVSAAVIGAAVATIAITAGSSVQALSFMPPELVCQVY